MRRATRTQRFGNKAASCATCPTRSSGATSRSRRRARKVGSEGARTEEKRKEGAKTATTILKLRTLVQLLNTPDVVCTDCVRRQKCRLCVNSQSPSHMTQQL